jgi:hypothetical protein
MKRKSFYAASTSCLALATVFALNPIAGASSGGLTGRGPSTSLASEVALRGRIVDANGNAVAGARVQLYAWPASWPDSQVTRPGEQVPTRLVGQAVTTATGLYAVRVAVAALRASAISAGIVNLQASVVGATGASGFYPFSVRIITARSGSVLTRFPASSSTRAAAEKVFRLSRSATRLVIHPGDFCDVRHVKFIKNYKAAWGTIDETYMNRSGVQAQANIVRSQTTTFGVGISASGAPGSFSENGSFTFKNTIGFKFKWYNGPGSQAYRMNYRPAKYQEYWSPGHCTSGYFTQPDKQLAGHRVVSAGKIPIARHCDPESPGTLSMSSSTATTISAALTVAEIGFKATAQTGWSETDTLSYKSNLNTWWFCGVKDDPAGSPGRVVAGKRPR